MALVKTILAQAIKAAFDKQAGKQAEGDAPQASIDELSSDIADAIDMYIKSGTVTVTGTIVGTSPAGPVTGTCAANGTIA